MNMKIENLIHVFEKNHSKTKEWILKSGKCVMCFVLYEAIFQRKRK